MRQPFDIEDPQDNERSRKSSQKSARSSLFAWKASEKSSFTLPIKIVVGVLVLCGVSAVVYFLFLRGESGVRRVVEVDTPHGNVFDYRNLELTNGLKVLLGSNMEYPGTVMTLCVGAGVLDETPKHVGLANVVAVALRDTVNEDRTASFYTSVHVSEEMTCFSSFISLSIDDLSKVSARFADMFIDPKFDKDVLKNLLDDDSTFATEHKDTVSFAVLSEDVNPDHPVHYTARVKSRFASQKLQGTPEELQLAATAYFKANYVSNDMSVVIAGARSLDELQKFATSSFGKIPASSSGKDESVKCGNPAKYGEMAVTKWEGFVTIYDPHPQPSYFGWVERWRKRVSLHFQGPTEELPGARRLRFSWRIPEWHAGDAWSTKPWSYAKWALSWEGPGSILSQLHRKGWAHALLAGVETGLHGDELAAFELFKVDIQLTEDGSKNIQGIGEIVFAYMQLLRDSPQDWVMEEQKKKGDMIAYLLKNRLSEAAKNALKYPPEYVLTGPVAILEVDMPAALQVLSHLAMDKCRVEFVSDDEEIAKGLSKTIEVLNVSGKWEAIKYDHKEIDASMLSAWKEASKGKFMESVLKLPPPNPFIFDRESLQVVQIDTPSSQPQLLSGAGMPRIYHQAYTERGELTFHMAINVYSKGFGGHVKDLQRWQLWCAAQERAAKEELYDANVVDEFNVDFDVRPLIGCLEIRVQTVGLVAEIVLKKLAKILIEPVTVPIAIKEARMAKLKGRLEMSGSFRPILDAVRKQAEALQSWAVPWADQLKSFEEFTEEDLTVDPKKLFESCFVEALVVGNVLPDDAKRYVEVFTSTVQASQGEGDNKMKAITPPMQLAILPEKLSLQKVDGVLKDVETHTIVAYLEVPDATTPVNAAFWHLLCNFLMQTREHKIASDLFGSNVTGWICPSLKGITPQGAGLYSILWTDHPPDFMLQLMHHLLNAALESAAKCDAETFDRIKTFVEKESKQSHLFVFLRDLYAYRHVEFEFRRLSFDSLQQFDSGIQAVDANKFRQMADQLKKRWLYTMIKKTATGDDLPEITKDKLKTAGIEEYSYVEVEAFDRDAFRSNAEWQDVLEHDLTKPNHEDNAT